MDLDYGIYNELVEEKKLTLFNEAKKRLNNTQSKVIKLAFEVASHAHYKQKRKSGEPYITHPTEVATIVADWGLDANSIAGAILHDVVEDTSVTKADLEQIFGNNIAELVDGVTKLEKLNFESEEIAHAEYFRKVVLAMAKDIRVILIKLADRLHNMLTLSSMNEVKRRRIALETMEIYVPIANKIGLHKIHTQLADESFRHLHPTRYAILSKAISSAQKSRNPVVENILSNIEGALKSNGIVAQLVNHERAVYNLYRRMVRRHQNFNQVYDAVEIKVLVKTIRDCYLTLGILHNLYQPLPGKFKDYIAIPKSNGYQSLHSTIMGPKGTHLQIHIRTEAMEEVAENGIISQWLRNQNEEEIISSNQSTSSWINHILDIQSASFSADEFLKSLKRDLLPDDIYVFTPKGKIILLPKGATPLDFAYYVHTDVGNHCSQAKVNQKLVKLNSKLENGDIVEIITKAEVEPSDSWLEIAVSGKAISKIKQYFKEQKYDEGISNGIKLINIGLTLAGQNQEINEKELSILCNKYYPKINYSELEHRAGTGTTPTLEIVKQILEIPHDKALNIDLQNCPIRIIQDNECLPIPGYPILAKITRAGELLLHTQTCRQNRAIGLDNLTLVNIINSVGKIFLARLHVFLFNRLGVFMKFAEVISSHNINMEDIIQEPFDNNTVSVKVTLGVANKEQLDNLMLSLSNCEFVAKVAMFNV